MKKSESHYCSRCNEQAGYAEAGRESLYGEIRTLTLVDNSGTKAFTIDNLRFEVRPSDNPLID